MRIKRFNEKKEEEEIKEIWVVIITDSGGFVHESHTKSFKNEMMAADYFIKWVNLNEEKDFEPFYEGDNRLFLEVDENPDWEECVEYCNDNEINEIEIVQIPILSNPVREIEL